MKLWNALLLILCCSESYAQHLDVAEEVPEKSSVHRRDESNNKLHGNPKHSPKPESGKRHPIEPSHTQLINDEESRASPEREDLPDIQQPPHAEDSPTSPQGGEGSHPPAFLMGRQQQPSPPGGGIPRIGEDFIAPPSPEPEKPWWESVKEWIHRQFH